MTAGQFLDYWRNRYQNGTGRANQTAPTRGGAPATIGQPRPVERWEDIPGGGQRNTITGQTRDTPAPVRQGRAPNDAERARGIDWVAPDGQPHYAPARTAETPRRLSNPEQGEIRAARTAARTARHVAELATEFLTLNRTHMTGMGRIVTGPINMASDGVRRMEAISAELTPLMRQGLPGAASDRDVEMFRRATVSTTAPGETNQRIAQAAQAAARRMAAYSQFLEWYGQQNGSLNGSQEDWDAYADANPLFAAGPNGTITTLPQQSWRQFLGVPERPRGGRGAPARPAAPAGRSAAQGRPQRPAPGQVMTWDPAMNGGRGGFR